MDATASKKMSTAQIVLILAGSVALGFVIGNVAQTLVNKYVLKG